MYGIGKRSLKSGSPPGTLIHIGAKRIEPVRITVFCYREDVCEEFEIKDLADLSRCNREQHFLWVNVDGVHDVQIIEKIGVTFDLHPLLLEDIVNTNQRPKVEQYEHMLFLIMKSIHYKPDVQELFIEQISFVLGKNVLITFQEQQGDCFDPVRERLRKNIGKIRKKGTDFLLYALIDAIIDEYFIVLEQLGDAMEFLEEEVIRDPSMRTLRKIYLFKKEVLFIRKAIWPLREVLFSLERREFPHISDETVIYLRDSYDHIVQFIDTIETLRDMLAGMLDIYLSSVSNRLNEIMKVLTIISTVFMPLTFITGVYGMNFEHMPELEWGYPWIWLVLLSVGGGMIWYFKQKRWL